jgi:hypothetical protein
MIRREITILERSALRLARRGVMALPSGAAPGQGEAD